MNNSLKAWKLIADSIRSDIPVMLLQVLESKGSSPGRQGFLMAVNADGLMEGSIGGGVMEHKFVEMAREKLRTVSYELRAGKIKKQVHDKSAATNQSGMICSGEQIVLLYPVKPSDKKIIGQIIDSISSNKNGSLFLSPGKIYFTEEPPKINYSFQMRSEDDWEYREKTGYKNQLSIIGGGHCALALSAIMSQMDFYIRVYDDRKDLKTMNENTLVHEKHFVGDYSALKDLVRSGSDHFVVIMTFGYRTDDIAIRAMQEKKFCYLGVLGSAAKMKKLFADYRSEGMIDYFLNSIHTPIGLSIKSQTPEEIAISIAAEIIREKNK